ELDASAIIPVAAVRPVDNEAGRRQFMRKRPLPKDLVAALSISFALSDCGLTHARRLRRSSVLTQTPLRRGRLLPSDGVKLCTLLAHSKRRPSQMEYDARRPQRPSGI